MIDRKKIEALLNIIDSPRSFADGIDALEALRKIDSADLARAYLDQCDEVEQAKDETLRVKQVLGESQKNVLMLQRFNATLTARVAKLKEALGDLRAYAAEHDCECPIDSMDGSLLETCWPCYIEAAAQSALKDAGEGGEDA